MRREDIPALAAAVMAFAAWLQRKLGWHFVLTAAELQAILMGLLPVVVWYCTKRVNGHDTSRREVSDASNDNDTDPPADRYVD